MCVGIIAQPAVAMVVRIWRSLGNAFEALQKKLLCRLRPDASALTFTAVWQRCSRGVDPQLVLSDSLFPFDVLREPAEFSRPQSLSIIPARREEHTVQEGASQSLLSGVWQRRKRQHFQLHPSG